MKSHKHIINILLVYFLCISVICAQETFPEDPVYFELGNSENSVQAIFQIHEGGLLVMTGKKAFINIESSVHDRNIHYFNSKMQHMWSKSLLENYNASYEDWRVLSNGQYIYFITTPHLPGMTLKMNLTQMRRTTGRTKKFFINDNDDPKALFIDEENLYILRYFEEEEFILSCIDHKTFKETKYTLNVPSVKNDPDCYKNKRWDFLGFNENCIFMYKKNVSLKQGKEYSYDIIKLSKQGKLLNGFNLNAVMDKHYVNQTNNPHLNQFRPEKDYKKKIYGSMDPTVSSFGDLYLDTEEDMFYVFGQYGRKRCGKENCIYDGVFLQKYNLSGKLLWKSSIPFNSLFKERDPVLAQTAVNKFNKRLMDIEVDNFDGSVKLHVINVKKGKSWAYVVKFDIDGKFMTTIRGTSMQRPYVKNRAFCDDPFNYYRYYYYDSYYKHNKKVNTGGEYKFQELANLTPELNMGFYELFSFKKGEVVFEKENGRNTIVFYYVRREELF